MRTPGGGEKRIKEKGICRYIHPHKRRASVLQTVREEASRLIYVR